MEKDSGGNFVIHDLDFWILKIQKSNSTVPLQNEGILS
jgi:hypothetical protein